MAHIHFEDLRNNRVLYPLIEKELKNLVYNFDNIALLNQSYKQEIAEKYSRYIGTNYTVFVDSGTSALILALAVLGIGKGDKVILQVNAYEATVFAILAAGATPIFVDIKDDANMNEDSISKAVDEKTKAIIPVYMYGICADILRIKKIADKYNLKIIEDVCQAHGSQVNGRRLGSFGDIGTFSFNPHKNISTLGNGGALTFNDVRIREKIYDIIYYDREDPSLLKIKRPSPKMSFADMAFLNAKLKAVRVIEENKKNIKEIYEEKLNNLKEIKLIKDANGHSSIRQFYLVYVKQRDQLYKYLYNKKIICRHPYKPLHLNKLYSNFAKGLKFPVADEYYLSGLCLPMFSFMKKQEVGAVCREIKDFYL